jgi:hypothetical protein
MGKGSDYRPHNKKKFDKNFDAIFGEKDIMEIHRDKTCGLKISWPEVDNKKSLFSMRDSKITGKRYVACAICGTEYIPGETEPCEHIKAIKEQCEDWLK